MITQNATCETISITTYILAVGARYWLRALCSKVQLLLFWLNQGVPFLSAVRTSSSRCHRVVHQPVSLCSMPQRP